MVGLWIKLRKLKEISVDIYLVDCLGGQKKFCLFIFLDIEIA